MRIVLVVLSAVLISSCSESENTIEDLRSPDDLIEQNTNVETIEIETPEEIPSDIGVDDPNVGWSYKVVSISENNWGYQLFEDGTMKINQTSIPSVQGVNGFDSEEKAERTAIHILQKLEKGIFPPTVDKEELDSLGVLRN